MAGTDVRAWYYMLRDLDPTARRYRAIVLGVDDYDDEDGFFNPTTTCAPCTTSIARLRLSDVPGFALLRGPELQWEASARAAC